LHVSDLAQLNQEDPDINVFDTKTPIHSRLRAGEFSVNENIQHLQNFAVFVEHLFRRFPVNSGGQFFVGKDL
jgi:hypothetical protein